MKCRKYAEYSAAIVGINETFPHEQMHKMLALLQVSSAFSPGSGGGSGLDTLKGSVNQDQDG
jgi:hypothetical protein